MHRVPGSASSPVGYPHERRSHGNKVLCSPTSVLWSVQSALHSDTDVIQVLHNGSIIINMMHTYYKTIITNQNDK